MDQRAGALLRFMMRIAHTNQDPGIAPHRHKGAAVHLDAMRRAFEALGSEVVAIDEPDPVRARTMLEQAHRERPIDLVYERYALGRYAAFEFASERALPYVLEVNAPLDAEARRFRGGADGVEPDAERRQFAGAQRVLVVSEAVATFARERGADDERVSITPNGVDVERFAPRSDETLRDSLVPPGSFVLGFHGRLRPWHGFERLASAADDLIRAGEPVFVLTVGAGPFAEQLEGRLPRERFRCIDWVPHEQVGAYVACFDALVLTYDADSSFYFSPLKLFEAMAAGVVPIVPDVGELGGQVRDGREGLVVPAGNSKAIVDRVARLIHEPDLRATLAEGARARAAERTWRSIAEHVLETAGGGAV